jgi:hypothetical protein
VADGGTLVQCENKSLLTGVSIQAQDVALDPVYTDTTVTIASLIVALRGARANLKGAGNNRSDMEAALRQIAADTSRADDSNLVVADILATNRAYMFASQAKNDYSALRRL